MIMNFVIRFCSFAEHLLSLLAESLFFGKITHKNPVSLIKIFRFYYSVTRVCKKTETQNN